MQHDDHGTLTYLRVYRGRLEAGATVLNTATGKRERVSRIYEMHANRKQDLGAAQAGDIVAVAGLRATVTGQTLSDPAHPLVLEQIVAPEPVIDIAVEPRTQADQQNLLKGLQALAEEDPSLRLRQDAESGQTLLSGMGELQLEVTLEKLRTRYKVEVQVGKPQVAYRETLGAEARVRHVHKKQSGGPGQFAEVALHVEPLERGAGIVFENRITGGAVPREFIPAVEAGVRRAAAAGVRAGYPLVDFKATLEDGSFHERDSSAMSFEIAGAAALRLAAARAAPVLIEPVMAVEVVTPADYVGDAIGDLNRRAVTCGNRKCGATPPWCRRTCRCRRCSATSASCARSVRAAPATRCSSTTMPRCPSGWPRCWRTARLDRLTRHKQNGRLGARFFARKKRVSTFVLGWCLGHQAGLEGLQVVVFGEIEAEIPGHGLGLAQVAVHDNAFHAVDGGRHAPGRVAQVAAGLRATGPKRTHDPGQPLGPIAGAERLAVLGDSLDEDFLGAGRNHRVDVFFVRGRCGIAACCGAQVFYLIEDLGYRSKQASQ